LLNIGSDDYPESSSTTAYEGIHMSGANMLTINDPEPRTINFVGDDTVFQLDRLPPTEAITGELRTAKINNVVDSQISGGVNEVTIGEAKFFGIGTNLRGQESQQIILAYSQATDTDPSSANFGKRQWFGRLFPKALLTQREPTQDENPVDVPYSVHPQFVTQYPWGVTFTSATEGYCRAQYVRVHTEFKPKLVAFDGDGAETTFAFPSNTPAVSTSKIDGVWVDGVVKEVTTDYTPLTTAVVFTTAPGSTAKIQVFYEENSGCS
jgi:hypothetical protein